MLGDAVEKIFKQVGITEDRYKAAKQALGLPPTCGCSGRKRALNEWQAKAQAWLAKQKSQEANPESETETGS